MNLLLYVPRKNGAGEQLVQVMETLFPDGAVDIFRTLRQLSSRLRKPPAHREIVVLLLPTRKHLEEILEIEQLLERVRLVAILPDGSPETAARGHLLRPRFITTADHRFKDVAAVLKKMGETARPAP